MQILFFALISLFTLSPTIVKGNEFAFCKHLESVKGGMYTDHSKLHLVGTEKVTSILVRKDIRRLYLLNGNQIVKNYLIALGKKPRGHKTQEGDFKTPEGIYSIILKNTESNYHKALKVSYPNAQDIARAKRRKVSPGGNILLHGLSDNPQRKKELMEGEHPVIDWTWGCVAVTDEEIDEIFKVVSVDTPIEICPLPELNQKVDSAEAVNNIN